MHHGSRLVSTEKFGHKRILSVGLQLTAFSDITNGPDVSVVAMRIGSPREVPAGLFRPIASRKLGTTRTHRQSPRLTVGTSLLPSRISHLAHTVRTLRHRSPPPPWLTGHPPPPLVIPSSGNVSPSHSASSPRTLSINISPNVLRMYTTVEGIVVRCQSRGSYSMTHRMESTHLQCIPIQPCPC